MTPYVSVILPVYNGMPLIKKSLESILAQSTPWPFEVIVIDSGSTDGTWQMVKTLPVIRIQIPKEEFNHGRTRNLGANKASGQFLVFTVQDAVPFDDLWLLRLVVAAQIPGAAGSYGMQLPWPSDNVLVRLKMKNSSPQINKRIIKGLPKGKIWGEMLPDEKLFLSRFDNTTSCLNREIWKKIPFNPWDYGEDLELGRRLILAGYKIIYEPEAAIFHSHDRSSWYDLKRSYADHELVARLFDYRAYPHIKGLISSWLRISLEAIQQIILDPIRGPEKLFLTIKSPFKIGVHLIGCYIGAKSGNDKPRNKIQAAVEKILRQGV